MGAACNLSLSSFVFHVERNFHSAPMFTTRRDCALRHENEAGAPGQPVTTSKEGNTLEGVMGHFRRFEMQRGGGAPFASISQTLGLRGGHSAQSMKEAKTGTEFPDTYCHLSRQDCPTLMGVG